MANEKRTIAVIMPGVSWFTLKKTSTELGNNYNILRLGHSCLGHGYDVYPKEWKNGRDYKNLVNMTMDEIVTNPHTKKEESGIFSGILQYLHEIGDIDCIICGSRGGQVVMPLLWMYGIDIPCVITNGGCIDSHYFNNYPPTSRVLFSTFGQDYFKSHNHQLMINTLQNTNGIVDGSILVHSFYQSHSPDDEYYAKLLPLMIDAVINGNIIKLSEFFIGNGEGSVMNK